MKQVLIAASLMAALPLAGNAATFNVFTDRDAFDAVAGDIVSFDLSSSSTLLTVTGDDVAIIDSVLFDRVDLDDTPDTVFNFGLPLFGFGAIFDISPLGPGSGISFGVTIAGTDFLLTEGIPSPSDAGFFGFTSDTAFDSVFLFEGERSSRPAESYTLTDPIGALNVAPVPLPAALPLLAVALGGLGFAARRRSKSA